MNALAPRPQSRTGRPYHGGSISKRGANYALQIYDGTRVQWAGTFATKELAEAAREKVRRAYARGAQLPKFRKARRACRHCRRPGHDARTCQNPPAPPRQLLTTEERGARITAGLLAWWAGRGGAAARAQRRWVRHPTRTVARAARPPACVSCFRVGHYASQCTKTPRISATN